MINLLNGKGEMKIISLIVILAVLLTSTFYVTNAQAGTVASDFLGFDGVGGKIVDGIFDGGCKLIGGTTYNMASSLYEAGTGVISLLTGQHTTVEKAAGWVEVGLNLAGAGAIIATIVTGSATLPIIAGITFAVAGGKLMVEIIKNGDKIVTWLKSFLGDPLKGLLDVYKPNIYLYSDEDRDVNVRLQPISFITESIPPYDPDTGWNARVYNGSLDGCDNFLFYEARVPDRHLQRKRGFPVQQSSLRDDMLQIMTLYGFNEKEKEDFIEYWENKLKGETNYVFYPQDTETVERIMPLSVKPQPDVLFRLWFLIEEDRGQEYELIDGVESIPRSGFTVVEWGGMMGRP